jgi:hypothetical protein
MTRHDHKWLPYTRSCSICGQLENLVEAPPEFDTRRSQCPRCEGTGVYNFKACAVCDGEGWISEAKLLTDIDAEEDILKKFFQTKGYYPATVNFSDCIKLMRLSRGALVR